jgi:hypothetical protein
MALRVNFEYSFERQYEKSNEKKEVNICGYVKKNQKKG